ncbi:MAG TPA: hypothetical protein VGD00_02225, partial [Solirubrobacteraceae bacterium]
RGQIATLERAVAELEATHLTLAGSERRPSAVRGPALLDAAALEDVRSQLLRRLVALQTAIDEGAIAAQDDAAATSVRRRASERTAPAKRVSTKADPAAAAKAPAKGRAAKRARPSGRPATA